MKKYSDGPKMRMSVWRFLALSLSPVLFTIGVGVAFGLLSRTDPPASTPLSVCDQAAVLVQDLPAHVLSCRTDSCVEWYIKQSQKWDAECHDAGTVEQ